jgi:type I restriction enzyme, S subunit
MSELPKSWAITSIAEIFDVIGGGTPSTKNNKYWNGVIPWITSADIKGVRDITIGKHVSISGVQDSATNIVPAKTLLVVTRVGLGKVAIAPTEMCFSQDLQGLRALEEHINHSFALYYLSQKLQELKFEGQGTTISGITKKQLKDTSFPLAPLEEQQRIVAKIEQLFSELNEGVEKLKTAQAQLKVYRQALLKHAFEGKLTANWRLANKDKSETSTDLLTRIKAERQARHQRQLNVWKRVAKQWENGNKKGKKPAKPRIFSEPIAFTDNELSNLSQLPKTWAWSKMGECFDVYVGATPSRKIDKYWKGTIPWVSSGEVKFFNISSTKELISQDGLINTSTAIHPVGTVMLAMIGEGKTRGQAAILEINACHNQNTAAIRVSETECFSEFVFLYLLYQYEITRQLGSGNNQKALNKERVSNMAFPLPPIDEQEKIVHRLSANLSVIEKVSVDIDTQIKKSAALRQSILNKAFHGQLVSQDPNDEPADLLLKRIKLEKLTQASP